MGVLARAVDVLVMAAAWAGHTSGIYRAWHLVWRRYEVWRYGWPTPPAMTPIEVGIKMRRAAGLWTPDAWWRLFDSISPPGRLEARILGVAAPRDVVPASLVLVASVSACVTLGVLGAWWWCIAPAVLVAAAIASLRGDWHSVDCDEFAVDSAISLRRGAAGADLEDGELVEAGRILQVLWRDPDDPWWKVHGHHVAVFRWRPSDPMLSKLLVLSAAQADAAWAGGGLWWHVSNWGRMGPFEDLEALVQGVADRYSTGAGKVLSARVADAETLSGWARVRRA